MNVKACNSNPILIKECGVHKHETWEIILQLSGENTSIIGKNEYDVTVGDVMVVPPNTYHSGFSSGLYTDIYAQAENIDLSDICFVHDYDGSILTLMKMLHKVMTEKETDYMTIADSIMDTICGFIRKNGAKNYKYSFVNDLKNALYLNISNADFKISDEIKKSGLNSDYFRRCFKEEMGKTPLEYYTDLKIRTAKKLLLEQSFVSVECTAEKCGYTDSFYFSKVFKSCTGLSPLNYRKKYMKNY